MCCRLLLWRILCLCPCLSGEAPGCNCTAFCSSASKKRAVRFWYFPAFDAVCCNEKNKTLFKYWESNSEIKMTGWKSEVKNSFTCWIHDGCMEPLKHVAKNAFMLFLRRLLWCWLCPFLFRRALLWDKNQRYLGLGFSARPETTGIIPLYLLLLCVYMLCSQFIYSLDSCHRFLEETSAHHRESL